MKKSINAINVGYIDEDINQVKIFTRALKEYGIYVIGYDIHRGMTVENILALVYNSDIDLLMIDFYLKDKGILTFNGDELARRFEEVKPRFPMIIFTSNENDAFDEVDDPNIIYNKDMVLENGKVERFSQTLFKNVENYSSYIQKRKSQIAELLSKEEKEGLDYSEQNSLITLQRELGDLDKTENKEIPEKLISFEKLDNLSKTRKEAEEFLQSLIDRNKQK